MVCYQFCTVDWAIRCPIFIQFCRCLFNKATGELLRLLLTIITITIITNSGWLRLCRFEIIFCPTSCGLIYYLIYNLKTEPPLQRNYKQISEFLQRNCKLILASVTLTHWVSKRKNVKRCRHCHAPKPS